MTVKELIEELNKYDENLEVRSYDGGVSGRSKTIQAVRTSPYNKKIYLGLSVSDEIVHMA